MDYFIETTRELAQTNTAREGDAAVNIGRLRLSSPWEWMLCG